MGLSRNRGIWPNLRWGAALFGGGVALSLVALVSLSGLGRSQAEGLDTFGDAPAFALVDQFERPVSSQDLRGTVVVANFVYTNCPDLCPLLSVRMQALQERLRQENLLDGPVQLLSFTVDPARDTATVLRAYAERHQADPRAWRFVTGPKDTVILLIVTGFHLGLDALPPGPRGADGDVPTTYEVAHGTRFVLIDRRWRVRAYYRGDSFDPEQVVADIRSLLR